MAHIAPHAAREPLPETDWLSEFPSEDQMDPAWSQSRAGEDPFDSFAHEGTASADVLLLPPADEAAGAAIDPAIRLVDVESAIPHVVVVGDRDAPAPRVKRPPLAPLVAGATAVLAATIFFVVPRVITTPELPPHVAPLITAAPSLPALAQPPPPDAGIAAAPEPPPATAPPAVERPNNDTTSVKPAPPTRPAAPPEPAAAATTPGTPQRQPAPPPPPSPSLALSPLGSVPSGLGRANSVVVSPPPEISAPPSTPSRPPPEPGRGSNPAATTPPAPIDLAAATVAAESAAIDVVLGGYRRAFSALDVERVAQVWPTVDRRALERAFRGLAKQTFEFHSCQVQPHGTEALASCSGRASYVPKVGGRAAQVETRQWQFTLTKQSGHWVIVAVESKR